MAGFRQMLVKHYVKVETGQCIVIVDMSDCYSDNYVITEPFSIPHILLPDCFVAVIRVEYPKNCGNVVSLI